MNILNFINALRETDKYIEVIYARGGCYRFHLLLKQMYPECEPMINMSENHVATLYRGKLYDINGVVKDDIWLKMTQEDILEAEKWSFAKQYTISFGRCPYCDEKISYEDLKYF